MKVLKIGFLFFIFVNWQIFPCPSCNIHNYLASSIESSSHIFHAEVIREINSSRAEVKVLKVIRGYHKKGSIVKAQMYAAKRYLGKQFIFSNPTSWPPRFEVLPPDFEDEILFLISPNKKISDLKEAIKRVQGVSTTTQQAGFDFLKQHHTKAIKPLIKELQFLSKEVFIQKDIFYGEHRLSMLIQALTLQPSKEAKQYILGEIQNYSKNQEKFHWSKIPHRLSSHGVFLRDLLFRAKKQKMLDTEIKSLLFKIYPTLSSRSFAEATAAMIYLEVASAKSLAKIIDSKPDKNFFALGLYFAGNQESQWWQHKQALFYWNKALNWTNNANLKKAILKRVAYTKKFARK